MTAVELIRKKREGGSLSEEELRWMINGYVQNAIPDYQMSAFLMACYFRGMNVEETLTFTRLMLHSGEIVDLSEIPGVKVDKHSTGGVGDKVSLILAPIVAACGVPVPMISGRGLGHTGGTLDKLDAIPGFRTSLSVAEYKSIIKKIGLVMIGQTDQLAPADKKMYALRDVTATVECIPLIAGSIMSKKLAEGIDSLVLDVKTGLGAFMRTLDEARLLAELMTSIGNLADRKVEALLSDMNQPLGHAVGNVLEVREAIDTLHGGGPPDFREHCLVVSAHMLALGGRAGSINEGKSLAARALDSGTAWESFRALVKAQGGDVSYVDHPEKMANATLVEVVKAPRSGYLSRIHARMVGEAAVILGAGRIKKGDPIDHAVGIVIHKKVGNQVRSGEPLFTIHSNNSTRLAQAKQDVLAAHVWSEKPVDPLPLFYN
jgi:pyrimidine-nucleoside phosphorylase